MIEYYTMESVREQIAGRFDVRSSQASSVPLPSWNRYPCSIIEACKRKKQVKCVGYVSIFVNTEKIRWLYLEISFFREKQKAFIRVDSLQMQKLFELGIITTDSELQKETF
jgi:hypothetical protein